MIDNKNGDLFTSNAKLICHQTNAQGVMGSGVAKQVKDKFPHIYKKYVDYCKNTKDILGTVLACSVDPNFNGIVGGFFDKSQTICNLVAQDKFGYDGQCYTSYEALKKCLNHVYDIAVMRYSICDTTIAIPYLMGCHRGGGDWNIVYNMIEEIFGTDEDIHCEIWKL